jgi:kelch-like protein 2/3
MREDGLLTDVTLVAGGKEVKAHKALLASCSPYFFAMFTGFDEKNKARVTLKDVDSGALEILINYVYTSEVEVTEENVQTLLPAANLMQLSDVKDACCEFLLNQLHPTNCLGKYPFFENSPNATLRFAFSWKFFVKK